MSQSDIGHARIGDTTIGGGVVPARAPAQPALPLFEPPLGPSMPFSDALQRRVHRFTSIKGYDQVRPRGIRAQRVNTWRWESMPLRTLEYIVSFFERFEGLGGPFFYDHPTTVFSPLGGEATLGNTTGATTSAATYWVRFSWYSSSASTETEASPTVSRLRRAGELLTISAPVIPHGADAVRYYVGTASGAETLKATLFERSYTEPLAGFPAGGSAPPSANNLKPRLRFVLVGDIAPVRVAANRWSLSLEVAEQSM